MLTIGSTPTVTRTTVLDVRRLTEATFVLRVDRGGLAFRAGQCVNLGFAGEPLRREYSVYSGEGDPHFEFLIRETRTAGISERLARCRLGDALDLETPRGDFIVEGPEVSGRRRYLLVATGTGIAPYHAMVRSVPGLDYRILHGVRYLRERYDLEDYAPDRYVACVSREPGGHAFGRVTRELRRISLSPDLHIYLCGNCDMVYEGFALLQERGMPRERMKTEVFF
jgi:ferredoxin-NADP reductase